MAHRFIEWDGWEEGLMDSIIGPEESEDCWYRDLETGTVDSSVPATAPATAGAFTASVNGRGTGVFPPLAPTTHEPTPALTRDIGRSPVQSIAPAFKRKQTAKLALPLPLAKEQEKERLLNTDGDYCGGRGGELGRRLEAWLTINGIPEGHSIARRWEREHESLNSPMPMSSMRDSPLREVVVE
jgi:hypothetical protein